MYLKERFDIMENKPLAKHIDKIKRIVNNRQSILQNKVNWHKLQTCMNAVSATEEALESYLAETSESKPIEKEKGLLYVYGTSQALFIQQNVIKDLCESLSLNYPNDPDLIRIRDIRNDITHPTDRNAPGIEYHNIVNVSPNADRFTLLTTYPESHTVDGNVVDSVGYNIINLSDHIETQKNVFIRVLDTILEALSQEENKGN